jgi:S-adenosylmethionine uptake transporter
MATLQENTRGAALMMCSMAAFTLNDASLKAISTEWPLFQTLTVRGFITVILIAIMGAVMGAFRKGIAKGDWPLVAARVGAEIGAAYFFLTALINLPLANATAILQTLPLTVSLAGALFLGEMLGWRRMFAILLGFVGVLLIVRPGADGFNVFSIYALIAVGFVTVRDLVTRRLSTNTHTMAVTFLSAAGVFLWAASFSTTIEWAPFTSRSIWLVLGASVFIIGGYVFSVMVMRVGDISFVAPFRYTALVWALVLGFVLFREWPSILTILGALIITGSGLFTFYRERRLAEREKTAAA